jgi:hypothetical protein
MPGVSGGAGDDIGFGQFESDGRVSTSVIGVGCTEPFEGGKTGRRLFGKQRGNRLVDGAIRNTEYAIHCSMVCVARIWVLDR